MSGPPPVKIEIRRGRVKVTPETVEVSEGEDVTWESEHPFVIFVQAKNGKRPTQGGQGVFGKGKGRGSVKARIVEQVATKKEYKYDVGVYDENADEMLGADPTIMVRP